MRCGHTPQPTGSGISIDENLIEISGDGNYLIKGDGNARDFYIDVHNEPTITLENVNLSHNGDPIMELNYVGEVGAVDVILILKGENIFSGNNIGIKNTTAINITISEESTGSLTFNTNTGIDGDAVQCGDIAINGGTVIFDTESNAIDGLGGVNHNFSMNGSGVVITNKPFNPNAIDFDTNDIESGIFFDNMVRFLALASNMKLTESADVLLLRVHHYLPIITFILQRVK